MNNIGGIHHDCAIDRYKAWQEQNRDKYILIGDYVKAKFDQTGYSSEYMWVQVTEQFSKDTFIGILSNVPNKLTNIKEGDSVRFTRLDIHDHINM